MYRPRRVYERGPYNLLCTLYLVLLLEAMVESCTKDFGARGADCDRVRNTYSVSASIAFSSGRAEINREPNQLTKQSKIVQPDGERPVRVRHLRHGRGDLETTSRPHPPIRRAAHVHIQSAARMPSRESADCPAMRSSGRRSDCFCHASASTRMRRSLPAGPNSP